MAARCLQAARVEPTYRAPRCHDMADEHERLDRVEDELALTSQHIEHEHRFMEAAVREGHSTRPAQKTLHALHLFRQALAQHRRILLKRLGLYRQ